MILCIEKGNSENDFAWSVFDGKKDVGWKRIARNRNSFCILSKKEANSQGRNQNSSQRRQIKQDLKKLSKSEESKKMV